MTETFDLVLRGGTVVNHDGVHAADVGIFEGRIRAVGSIPRSAAGETVDVSGLHVLPGVIDSQVHFREPGAEHKEDLESGSRAAVLGGITAVFEMPNTNPATTTAEALADKVKRATSRMFCDFAFYVGATRENVDYLSDLERLPGAAGVKVFAGSSTGNLLVDDEESLSRVISSLSRRAAFHSEDEARLEARKGERKEGDPSSHTVWRDEQAALISTERLVRLARRHGKRIHILHVSTADEMVYLADHKDVATVEVTPQHLTLEAGRAYQELGTRAQMNPPLRSSEHQAGLWHGLSQGVVDVLGSDHAPHTLEEKSKPYPASPSGMPGVQTLVPIMLDHVNSGRLSIERFVDLTSHGPQRIFGISRKGRIAVGYDADITVVDLSLRRTIDSSLMASRSAWTP
ncbi:MAG: dihydroorotase, partial [Pseudomonadota bacterium]|nr:dihydroorotase [Pseudomonadota bacterium]